jgi:hypothetical protein
VGTFENFKSKGYFENFRKTTITVMSENHAPALLHKLQFRRVICPGVM